MLKGLAKKESKRLVKRLRDYYDFYDELDYLFYKNNDEIYISSKELKNIKEAKSIGLFFCKELVLSIEGSQIIGPTAKKNVLEINEEEKSEWLRGKDLNLKIDRTVILKNGKDYLGCGIKKGNLILNTLEKKRLMNA